MMLPATRDASCAVSRKATWSGFQVWRALGGRFSRNLERLARAIAFAALLISGSMLLLTPMGVWHHILGEVMIVSGIGGIVIAGMSAMRRNHGRR